MRLSFCRPGLLRDPRVDPLIEHVERQCARIDHLVVKRANVELVAQRLLGAVAQFQDFQLADFVGQRLAGYRDVAIHFRLDLGFRDGRVIVEEVHHLLAGPVSCVNPGIDHQPDGAFLVSFQPPVVRVRVLVESDIFPEPLGVERPSFGECGVERELAELGNAGLLLGNRNLHVMAGKAFVVGGRFHFEKIPLRRDPRC